MKGLVLEGGGAKGSYQVGVLRALYSAGYEFQGVTGSSIGAINGAFIANDKFDRIVDIWSSLTIHDLFANVDEDVVIALTKMDFTKDFKTIRKGLANLLGGKVIDPSPMKKLLDQELSETYIRNHCKDFGVSSYSIPDFKPISSFVDEMKQGSLVDYLMASSRLPIFKQMGMNERIVLDGGFYDNLPVNMLIDRGYKDIVTIRLNSIGLIKPVKAKDVRVTQIAPRVDLGGVLDPNHDNIMSRMERGYLDGMRHIHHYQGKNYYIDKGFSDREVVEFLINLPEETVGRLGLLFGIEGNSSLKVIFEQVIPVTHKYLGLPAEASYSQWLVALYEHAAKALGVGELKVYQFSDFMTIIHQERFTRRQSLVNDEKLWLPNVLYNYNILGQVNKEALCLKLFDIIYKGLVEGRTN